MSFLGKNQVACCSLGYMGHLEETVRQHRLILAAIEDADADTADELAVLHHKLTTERIKKVLFSGVFDDKQLQLGS